MYNTHESCLIVDVYLDLCYKGCKIRVMKDTVICLSDVLSVKSIITAVIHSLSEDVAVKETALWESAKCLLFNHKGEIPHS